MNCLCACFFKEPSLFFGEKNVGVLRVELQSFSNPWQPHGARRKPSNFLGLFLLHSLQEWE